MVVGFRRSVSFTATPDAATLADKKSSYRVRSASLPCRFHPLTAALDDSVATLRRLAADAAERPSTAAEAIACVAAALHELFVQPQVADTLRRLNGKPFAERILDCLLRLADAHSNFRVALVALSPLVAETRLALRREDPARLAAAVRAQRRGERDIIRLAAAMRPVSFPSVLLDEADTAAMVNAVQDAHTALLAASSTLFSVVSSMSASAAAGLSLPAWAAWAAGGYPPMATPARTPGRVTRVWWLADVVRWALRAKRRSAIKKADKESPSAPSGVPSSEESEKAAALEKLERLENCVRAVEGGSERVLRELVNARVALLNILTPTF